MFKRLFVIFCLPLFLAACGGIDGPKYEEMGPPLVLEEYFDGQVKVWGIVQDMSGNIVRRFDADIDGSWDEASQTLILDEDFLYYDGETEKRIWTVKKLEDGTYRGEAGDIIGTARGDAYGNALRWKYEMDIPRGDGTTRLTFDDWMWLMNDGVLVNRSYLKKFGITVAEITIFMQRQ